MITLKFYSQQLGVPTVLNLSLPIFWHCISSGKYQGNNGTSTMGEIAGDKWESRNEERKEDVDGISGIQGEYSKASGGSGGHSHYSIVFFLPTPFSFSPFSLYLNTTHKQHTSSVWLSYTYLVLLEFLISSFLSVTLHSVGQWLLKITLFFAVWTSEHSYLKDKHTASCHLSQCLGIHWS